MFLFGEMENGKWMLYVPIWATATLSSSLLGIIIYCLLVSVNYFYEAKWNRLEDAGYAVGARVLELLCHREKVWLYEYDSQLELGDDWI